MSDYAPYLQLGSEVNDEANLEAGRSEIVQKLRGCYGIRQKSGFHFHDHSTVGDNVRAVCANVDAAMLKLEGYLLPDTGSAVLQLRDHGLPVDGLEESVSKAAMNFVAGRDY